MLTLLRKDSKAFFLYLSIISPLMLGYLVLRKQGIDEGFIMLQCQWIILLVLGGSIVTEQREEKTRGYEFLKILPIDSRTLVSAKFLLVLIGALLLTGFNGAVLALSAGSSALHSLGGTFLILALILSLLMAGGMYVLRFRFSQARATLVIWIVFLPLAVAPIVMLELDSIGSIDTTSLLRILMEHPLIIRGLIIIAGSVGFALLWKGAVRVHSSRISLGRKTA